MGRMDMDKKGTHSHWLCSRLSSDFDHSEREREKKVRNE